MPKENKGGLNSTPEDQRLPDVDELREFIHGADAPTFQSFQFAEASTGKGVIEFFPLEHREGDSEGSTSAGYILSDFVIASNMVADCTGGSSRDDTYDFSVKVESFLRVDGDVLFALPCKIAEAESNDNLEYKLTVKRKNADGTTDTLNSKFSQSINGNPTYKKLTVLVPVDDEPFKAGDELVLEANVTADHSGGSARGSCVGLSPEDRPDPNEGSNNYNFASGESTQPKAAVPVLIPS